MRRTPTIWFCALAMSTAAVAQMPTLGISANAPICQLPDLMLAWRKPPASLGTVRERTASDLAGRIEQPYRIQLQPCSTDWCKVGSYAAMVKMDLPQAGRYRVAVDRMLWIDLYTSAVKLEGLLCEHAGCAPIRKIVQFDVSVGPHWVVLERRDAGEVGLMVTRVAP